MSVGHVMRRWRDWFPIPTRKDGFGIKRWVLLEANRLAVTGALLTFVFVSFITLGTIWTYPMQDLLNDTAAVQTILNTLLSGMILLVSIVVSINSIVLSHDMSSITNQEDRVKGASSFRRDLSKLSRPREDPSEPASFLKVMSRTISERAQLLDDNVGGVGVDGSDEIRDYVSSIADTADALGDIESTNGADFGILWKGMGFNYGTEIEHSRTLQSAHGSEGSDRLDDQFEELIDALELFAIGKEYFKTLYYTREVSKLSQTLLVVTLPAILINASTILAIDAEIFPEIWVLGLPPLQSFVAATFTISLAPYLVLTAYMLRLSAVARLTSSAGIFSLN